MTFRSIRSREFFSLLFVVATVVGCNRKTEDPKATGSATNPQIVQASNQSLPSVPGFEGTERKLTTHLNPILDRVTTKADSWDTEVFSELAKKQLETLAKSLSTKTAVHSGQTIISTDFQSQSLQPRSLKTVLEEQAITVRRAAQGSSIESADGFDSLAAAAQGLYQGSESLTIHFKLVRVETQSEFVRTDVLFESHQRTTNGSVQKNARWNVVWETPAAPKIRSIQVSDFEEVETTQAVAFADVTHAVLGKCDSYREQLSRGVDFFRKRLEANYGVDPNGNQGLAIGDVNGDGLEDLFVCQQGGLPNRLYVQRANGVLEDVSQFAGVDWMEVCRSALFVDLDNDGDQDLVMAQGWYIMIMSNDGSGRFQDVLQQRSQANLHSMSAADFDNDGDVDLFLCGRNPGRELGRSEGILGTPIPYHDANNGGPNILLRNNGGLRFEDVTKAVGLDVNNRRYSYAASWEDYDNDGDMDLYVANDFGRNNLYRNDLVDGQRHFTDVAAELGVEDISAGMSITWGDYNNDGNMDAYVSNMFSSAGNRIAYQRRFREVASDGQRAHFQRHARGNTLFQATNDQSDVAFRDVSETANVTMGRWAWGAKFCDFNCDGWQDLYVANGFITTQDTGDL